MNMTSDKYIRWQGYAIRQLTFALNMFFGMSVGALAFVITLIRDDKFILSGCTKLVFQIGLVSLCFAVLASFGVVVSRLLDFRFTARKVRADDKEDQEESDVYKYKACIFGKLTWRLFWIQLFTLIVGLIGLVVGVLSAYSDRLL